MRKFYLLFVLAIFIFSCSKNSQKPQTVSQDFYISFSASGNNYIYPTGAAYQYVRDGSQGFALDRSFSDAPATLISPLPTNLSIQDVGFVFGITNINVEQVVPWQQIGDSIFKIGSKGICYTGINYISSVGELSGWSPNSVTIFWLTPNGSVYNSGSGRQVTFSYFQIDTVLNFHHDDPFPLKTYDKIISGTFGCRVFNPLDTANFYDIINGKFRMPVWRNAAD